ncbi:aminopeptidase N-like [Tautogolabrus adspersus]
MAQYRLPADLIPVSYNITLWPRLRPSPNNGLYIFTGHSTVKFECVKETAFILIHSNKLIYSTLENTYIASLSASDGGSPPSITKSWLQPETQYLVIHLSAELTPNRTYELYTEFAGELADDLEGFYRSEYEEDGVKKIVATSQMHPTHARKTFPCFDEPAMKAVFHITLIHPAGTVALSNGMEIDIMNFTMDGEAVTRTNFEPTKKMSSYLLAIIVSDYTHIRSTQGDTLIRIWARRKAIEQGQGSYALNVTGPILDFFQSYYNISYPLSKSDQIALPDFYFGAMENWGLVTYRETNLLYDPVTSSNRNKETTATIIAHELAHMWFGNLVTLRWWNEVWLNEGFASYVSYLGADYAEPTWNVKDLIVLDDVQKVMAVDALTSSHPLSSKEDSIILPNQITEQFDTISYSKGAAVLRMMSDFLSEPVFVQGLSSYLNHFSYNNTAGEDLWDHLQMAVKANDVSLPEPVNIIMNRWVHQMGFPLITINTKYGIVSQKHFLLDPDSTVMVESPYNYEWIIPIRGMKKGVVQRDIWWLRGKEAKNSFMHTQLSWVLANVNVTGYYRVHYDSGNWESLFLQLCTDHQEYVKELVTPLYLYFKEMTSNWAHVPEGHTDQYNQANAIQTACKTGLTECHNLTTGWFKQWMDNPQHNPIPPNLRSAVYCSAMAEGDVEEWNFAMLQYKIAPVASEASKLMAALACTNNTQLLGRYLYYSLNPAMIRKQDASFVITSVASNTMGQSLAWDFVREQWFYMFTQYGVGSFSFASIISGVTARLSTPAELQQLEEFVDEHSAVGFGSATQAVKQALERTRANIKWLQLNKEYILDWLNSMIKKH